MIRSRPEAGVSALPTILLITAIIIEVSVVSAVIATTLSNTRFSERLGAEALSAANAGAHDAMIRVIRFKDCPSDPDLECPSAYSLAVGSRSADITISAGAGTITIVSTGIALSRQKRVRVILGVDSVTGEVATQSFREIAL